MSKTLQQIVLVDVVAAGSKDENGRVFGGIYMPRHKKAGGNEDISAKWQGRVFINRGKYTNQAGQQVELKSHVITLTGWNSRDAKPGHGMADLLAKTICPGKTFTIACEINSFDRGVYDKAGRPVIVDGVPLTVEAVGFEIVPGSLRWGNDPAKVIAHEIATGIRPAGWNNAADPKYNEWMAHLARRQDHFYQGGPAFGYARVLIKKDEDAFGLVATGALQSFFDGLVPTAKSDVPSAAVPSTGNNMAPASAAPMPTPAGFNAASMAPSAPAQPAMAPTSPMAIPGGGSTNALPY